MKTKILIAAFALMTSSGLRAQYDDDPMRRYMDCVDNCAKLAPEAQKSCIEGCATIAKCPNATVKVLSTAQDLQPLISTSIITKSAKNLIYSDAKYQYFVLHGYGVVNGYQIKSREDGAEAPFPVVDFTINGIKSYYIFDANGKYLKVKKPDVTPIFEIVAKVQP